MDNGGTACGIYNDTDNEWMFYAADNGAVNIYHNGIVTLYTGTAATGGAFANNTLTGSGNERVLTVSDKRTAGSFTGTLTGMSASTTGTYNYRIEGNQVTIYRGTALTGTSTATTFTMTGLPAAIQPQFDQQRFCGLITNATVQSLGLAKFVGGSGTLTFSMFDASTTTLTEQAVFANTGTKGTSQDWSVTYSLG